MHIFIIFFKIKATVKIMYPCPGILSWEDFFQEALELQVKNYLNFGEIQPPIYPPVAWHLNLLFRVLKNVI